MEGPDVELGVAYLTEIGLARGDIDEDDADGRGDASSFGDGTDNLVVLAASDGRCTSRLAA